MFIAAVAVAVALVPVPTAFAWGTNGHEVIAMIAEEFLTQRANDYVSVFFRPFETLQSVSNWADGVKQNSHLAYTGALHYVNINDDPPTSCGYDDDRDCQDGDCIVRAIADYTDKAMCGHKGQDWETYYAIKFLVHFVGDITQPLHASYRNRGGTQAAAKFNGRKKNLHSVWDTSLPEKRIQSGFGDDHEAYAAYLVDQIRSGVYKDQAPGWISRHGLTDRNHNNNSMAAIDWAADSDALLCSVVWPDHDTHPKQDHANEYYDMAVSTVDLQLAKGGYRLANWINRIAETC